ncbi:MAG: PAS domain S-box protein [Pirellulaceae bacterium]|nr:PAS domain S-box protein [Pirellulaceae bacterium]
MSGLNGSLFPAVFGETSALVWTADRDLRLTSWFGSALESQGLEDGRAPGIPLVEFFQLQDRASPMVAAHVHALRGDSITFAFELSDRCYDAFVTPQRDAQGHVFGCLGIAREPSRLDQETKQLCRLFNLSRQMLCTATVDGYFRRLDPALAATLGYSVDDLRARPLIEFVHPADRDTTLKELAKLANGQPTLRFENRYRCKDGSYRWLSWTSIPEDEEGVLYATALDITERKRAEELFRAALESAPDAVVIVDLVGEIILVNSVAESMFGYSRTELLGQPVELLVPPAFRRHHIENRGNYSAGPSVRPMGPSRCVLARRKDGSEIPIEVTLSPVDLDEGRISSPRFATSPSGPAWSGRSAPARSNWRLPGRSRGTCCPGSRLWLRDSTSPAACTRRTTRPAISSISSPQRGTGWGSRSGTSAGKDSPRQYCPPPRTSCSAPPPRSTRRPRASSPTSTACWPGKPKTAFL